MRLTAVVAGTAFVLVAARWCPAAISGITTTPNPACVGIGITLTAVEDGLSGGIPSQAFYWEQYCANPGCMGNWVVLNGVNTQSINQTSMEWGTRTYRVTRSYASPPPFGYFDSKFSTTVTWAAPTSIAITSGDVTPTNNCSTVNLEFTLSCFAPGFNGLIEEKIWRGKDVSDWTKTSPTFYFDLGKIIDVKANCITPPSGWDAYPTGEIDKFDQQIRMTVNDCCGQPGQPVYFTKKQFMREKLANGQWQIKFLTDL